MNPSFPTAMLAFPSSGNKAIPRTLDFSTVATVYEKISDDVLQANSFDFVQGIYVDNSSNNAELVLTFKTISTAGNVMKIPANAQAFMPVMVPKGIVEFSAQTTIGVTVEIHLLNFPVAPCVWPSATVANVTANIAPINGAYTDRGVTLTGGTDNVMNANLARKAFYLQANPANIAGIIIQYVGGSQLVLQPGDKIETNFVVTTQQIEASGTAGDKLMAGEI